MPSQTGATLLAWFERHKRDLPWRRTRDPYAIWVSEIMLQQTRVAAVLDHYARWMRRFPTVAALAGAEEAEVLALWSGLGYYRRARMLHRAARVVVEDHDARLPRTAIELRTLPGIGEYTSAAIASIAFGEAIAVVDGNVERVMMRLLGTRLLGLAPSGTEATRSATTGSALTATALAKAIRAGATELLDEKRAGDSNQAMMELGATVCLPKAPLCLHCPLQQDCLTRGQHTTAPRKALIPRAVVYALVQSTGDSAGDSAILLHQRDTTASLMAGMWELPELAAIPEGAELLLKVKHSITVTSYSVSVVRLAAVTQNDAARWVKADELDKLPLTGLARKVLRKLSLWTPEQTLGR